jgi:Zonular occludens toxin (Zot).
MAIRLIQGKIGSGKTYYAVNHVLKSYYTWSDELDSWVPKEKDVNVRVYTNIKNMKLGEDLDKFISNAGGLSTFFNNKYQETFCMNSNVIYIIDEAQAGNYFHRKFYDVNVFLFFQMHRHLGCDIYLITQDVRCLARELQQLAEYVIKAVRRSNSIGKSFTYKFYSGDECFKTKRIKQDQKVFGMYRSMIIGEGEKIKSIPFKHILIFVGLVVCAGLIFRFGFMKIFHNMNKHNIRTTMSVIDEIQEPQLEPEELEKENSNMYDIVGMVANQYIVKTSKGLKRVKIKASDNKIIGDQIKIEKL